MSENKEFKTVIISKHKLLDLHLKEVFEYKDLIKLFVKRDFTSLYNQTILGPAWAIILPLFTTFVFTIVFGNIDKLTITDIQGTFVVLSFLFYTIGIIRYSYFSRLV